MVFLRAPFITIGIATLAACLSSSLPVPVDSLLERDNKTENTAGITLFAVAPGLWSYCGADIVGGDIFAKRYPSPDDCVTNCLPSTGCNAGTWTRFEGGTCYFKRVTKSQTQYINVVPNVGAVSFLRKDGTTPSELHYPVFSVDMPGNDLANLPVGEMITGIPKCDGYCQDNERCSAFTWSSYNGGTCWLKTKPSPYVVSNAADTRIISNIVGHHRNAAACLAFV